MDAFVQLALIEKAKQVFATDPGLMLCFPLLSPVSFTAAELAALAAPASAADYAAAADFARIVNFLPRDLVASASDRMLWDVYLDVLERADIAHGTSPVLEEQSDAAVLYETAPDGTRTDSEALRKYRQYRDAWLVSREDYGAQKLTGELSEDASVRQRWAEVDELRLRAAINAAAQEWESVGQRTAIELALKAQKTAALQNPALRWAEWSDAFNPDLDMITEAGGTRYAPTGLSPRNFAEQEDWLDFEMTQSEMTALVEAAPPELKGVLDGSGPGEIEKVSFQYRSVGLVRSWFRPDALSSRIWRSADPALLLSDGGDPAEGVCPAYVSACVFVRDVVEVKNSTGGANTDQPIWHFEVGALKPGRLVKRELRVDPAIFATAARRSEMFAPVEMQLTPAKTRSFRALDRNTFKVADRMHGSPVRKHRGGALAGHLQAIEGFQIFQLGQAAATPTPTPTPPPPPPPPPVRDEISVLAFICKRLPKAPDPAPELTWA